MGFGGPKSLFVTSESEEAPVFTEVALVVMIALEMVGATLCLEEEVSKHNSTSGLYTLLYKILVKELCNIWTVSEFFSSRPLCQEDPSSNAESK